ncbi:MAG: hypothetical protein KDK70_30950, partial [Myxococcales bacterium]|nr:hypothetical protein [Myxococcales bacterium]
MKTKAMGWGPFVGSLLLTVACAPEDWGTAGDLPADEADARLEAGALAEAPRSASLDAGLDLGIAKDGGDVVLSWSPLGDAVDYTVWHGDHAYWQPGDAGTVALTTGPQTSLAHAVAGDGNHHYYRVVAHASGGDVVSTAVGKFSHRLHPGFNKLPQPLDTGLIEAQDLLAELGGLAQGIHEYDATIQGFVSTSFGYGLGEVPIAESSAAPNTVFEEVGRVPAEGELALPLADGLNLVTVPLSMGDTTASAVLAAVAPAWRVGWWDPIAQDRVWHDGSSPDFAIAAGDDIY